MSKKQELRAMVNEYDQLIADIISGEVAADDLYRCATCNAWVDDGNHTHANFWISEEEEEFKMASIYNDEDDIHMDLYWVEADSSVVARFTKDGEEVEEDTALPAETLYEAQESVAAAYQNNWQLTWEG